MPEPSYELLREIALAAEKHGVDLAIIAGIVNQESSFDPEAVGDAGMSFGLMQLHLQGAGSGRDPVWLLEPSNNLDMGTAYYKANLERFGTVNLALSAYNQGGAGLERNGVINQHYVAKVLEYAEHWRPEMQRVGALMHLDAPIDFDAIDGAPVDLLFVLLVPEAATDAHLELLRQIASMLDRKEVREKLREMLLGHYTAWLDTELPILGNRTPRQVVRDADGREAVEALTRGLLAKLLHDPTVRLKDAAGSPKGERLAGALTELSGCHGPWRDFNAP